MNYKISSLYKSMKTFSLNIKMERLFENEPELFIERTIKDFARSNPANCLDCFGNEPIFEKPLVGFADGDDPLFHEYKKVVHEDHYMPREVLELHLSEIQELQNADHYTFGISFILQQLLTQLHYKEFRDHLIKKIAEVA